MHETNDVFKMPICLNEVLLRIRQLCVRSQLGSHALRSRSGGLGTQDFQVLRQSCYGAVLVIRIVRFQGQEAPWYRADLFQGTGTTTDFMDWGFWKDFRAARIHQFSWKFCLPAPVFLSGTPFSGLADLLGHLQCSRLPWEPEDCCCFHIVFLVFPHRMVLALIFPPLQSTAVALQLLSDFFCSPYESHRNT